MEELLFNIAEDDDIYNEIIKGHLNDRRIVINQDITDELLENVCLMIMKWNSQDKNLPVNVRKPIYIYINSDGGDCIMGTMLLSIIEDSITPVNTVGFAKCASMASYILASGKTRYAFPSTIVLLHDGTASYCASGNKGKDIQKFYDELDRRQGEFMVKHTNMSAEYLEEIKDRELYIWADEAKEKGIIDKIIGIDCTLDEILG